MSVSHANNRLWADEKTYAQYWSGQVPSLKSPYFYLADAYQRQGDLENARKNYQMVLSGALADAYVFNNLGMIDDSDGHFKQAELDYKRALKISPHSSNTNHNLGALYLEQGQLEKAGVFFRRALAYNPLMLEIQDRRSQQFLFTMAMTRKLLIFV